MAAVHCIRATQVAIRRASARFLPDWAKPSIRHRQGARVVRASPHTERTHEDLPALAERPANATATETMDRRCGSSFARRDGRACAERHRSRHEHREGRHGACAHRLQGTARSAAHRLRRAGAGAHRAGLSGRDQRRRALGHRIQHRQPAHRQRRAGRRTLARGAEPAARGDLPGGDPGAVAAGLAAVRHRPAAEDTGQRGVRRRQGAPGDAAAGHRFPPRRRWRRPRAHCHEQQPDRRGRAAPGRDAGGRVHAGVASRGAAAAPGRDRLRHGGRHGERAAARGPGAPVDHRARRLGAERLPDRRPVRHRGARAQDRSGQAHAGHSTCARCCR